MAATVDFLGDSREFKGGQVAELGHWLVVYRNNRPVSLYSTGIKVRRLISAPVIGASVSSLNTMPQDISHVVLNVVTSDGYTVPSFTVRLQVRLTPEGAEAPEILLRQIELYGARFFDSTEAEIRRRVEEHVRERLRRATAESVLQRGPADIAFPTGTFPLERQEVQVTSIQGIDWQEGTFAREVREARERDVAERAREQLDRDARERMARAQLHQQDVDSQLALDQQVRDAELSRQLLTDVIDRAHRLGLDPVAIAEPEVWRQVSQQHSDVLNKLLESQHLYPMFRSSPDLMRAIIDRLGGRTSALPLGRQADMVLDGLDPQRALTATGTVYSTQGSAAYMDRAKLIVDPVIDDAWRRAGGSDGLSGAGHAIVPGSSAALVLVLGVAEPIIPPNFAELVRDSLPTNPRKVSVRGATGETLPEAVQAVVHRISPATGVSLVLRKSKNQREVLVNLSGPADATASVFAKMTDPANPILPALESLVGNRVQIRFARLGA